MTAALLRELELQRDYLGGADLASVYFGGGTPSLLEIGDLVQIFEKINSLHKVAADAEITLEANPDDLTPDKLAVLRRYTPVNRLSIGIQSFFDEDLRWMNRAHAAADARSCVEDALAAGFGNLTADLIYGAPTTTDERWQYNVRTLFDYGVQHLSCYCLTVEEGTALAHFVQKGKAPAVDEDKAARQLEWLMDAAAARGYEHYEISNFALPGWYARHNSNYWRGSPYLGIGPSAHSYNGVSRQWNVANNALYLKALEQGRSPFEIEILTPAQRYNEYVMTALRTIWGCEPEHMRLLGTDFAGYFEQQAQRFVREGTLEQNAGAFRLTRAGKLLADRIAMELFWVENGQ